MAERIASGILWAMVAAAWAIAAITGTALARGDQTALVPAINAAVAVLFTVAIAGIVWHVGRRRRG